MNKVALIMAGGCGSRLWPISTDEKPKQFLNLFSNEVMINETIIRIEKIFDYKDIFVVINKNQEDLLQRYLDRNIPKENIIVEPESKSTSMCIFYSLLKIKKLKQNAVISIFSADHYIECEKEFMNNINEVIDLANELKSIFIVGINPTYPSEQFGYIKYMDIKNKRYKSVIEFKEKPKYEKALKYIESSNYVWNAGIFVCEIDILLKEFEEHLVEIAKYKKLIVEKVLKNNETKQLEDIYKKVPNVPIDKGIIEKTKNLNMFKATFKWSDIGNFRDFFEIYRKDILKNTLIGKSIVKDVRNTNVYNNTDEIMLLVGVENINVIKDNGVCIITDNKIYDLKKIYNESEKKCKILEQLQ